MTPPTVHVTKMIEGMLALSNDSVLGAWSGAAGGAAVGMGETTVEVAKIVTTALILTKSRERN